MDINIETQRSLIINDINQINDISLLRAVRNLILSGLMNEGRISIEQYNKELDEADARIDKGEFYTNEEVVEMSKKW